MSGLKSLNATFQGYEKVKEGTNQNGEWILYDVHAKDESEADIKLKCFSNLRSDKNKYQVTDLEPGRKYKFLYTEYQNSKTIKLIQDPQEDKQSTSSSNFLDKKIAEVYKQYKEQQKTGSVQEFVGFFFLQHNEHEAIKKLTIYWTDQECQEVQEEKKSEPEQIKDVIRSNDEGDGVMVEDILSKLPDIVALEKKVNKLKEMGELYEPKPGYLKVLE